MKTAMQNLIEHFDRIYDTKCSEQEKPILASVLNFANESLEKEKEQIIDAYANAVVKINGRDYIGMNEEFLAKEYYNQTYNKNK
jgi:hypothetical protein